MGMLTETLVTALPAGITARGEAGALWNAGQYDSSGRGQMVQLYLVTPLYSVNMHSLGFRSNSGRKGGGAIACTSAM